MPIVVLMLILAVPVVGGILVRPRGILVPAPGHLPSQVRLAERLGAGPVHVGKLLGYAMGAAGQASVVPDRELPVLAVIAVVGANTSAGTEAPTVWWSAKRTRHIIRIGAPGSWSAVAGCRTRGKGHTPRPSPIPMTHTGVPRVRSPPGLRAAHLTVDRLLALPCVPGWTGCD
jgi:hypothetical protein